MSKHKRTIKAVTFDLWETLLLETDGANSRRLNARCKSLHRALDKFGVKISVARLESALKETILSLVHVWETNKDVAFPIDRMAMNAIEELETKS